MQSLSGVVAPSAYPRKHGQQSLFLVLLCGPIYLEGPLASLDKHEQRVMIHDAIAIHRWSFVELNEKAHTYHH